MSNEKIQLGLQETKEALTFAFGLTGAIADSYNDDKQLTGKDIPNFIKPLLSIKAAFEDIDLVPVEFMNITEAQSVELKAWTKENFNIPDDKLEAAIEDAISIILDIWTVYVRYFKVEDKGTMAEGEVPTGQPVA